MSNIDKQATELLIENGELVADTLRHLADNEIDSDYFAICHSTENGTEIECELAITDYARQAAGTVDELVKALEAAERRIAELEARTVTLPENITSANAPEVFEISSEAERLGLRGTYASYAVGWNARGIADKEALREAGVKVAAAGKGE